MTTATRIPAILLLRLWIAVKRWHTVFYFL
jgi:hypothetical protein